MGQAKNQKHDVTSRAAAFTLIELLVVVSIIALLLSIMMPALNAARSVVKRTACQSNLRQIAMAWQIYLDDNEGYFYQGVNANHSFGGKQGTFNPSTPRPLNEYLDLPRIVAKEAEADVFLCPADTGHVNGIPVGIKAYDYYGGSYQTNVILIGPNKLPFGIGAYRQLHKEINNRLPNLNRSKVAQPSRLLLVGDNNWVTQWDPYPNVGKEWHKKESFFCLAFLDGHTEFLKILKGVYVCPDYRVQPFRALDGLAYEAASNK